jgi:hypothetical protein
LRCLRSLLFARYTLPPRVARATVRHQVRSGPSVCPPLRGAQRARRTLLSRRGRAHLDYPSLTRCQSGSAGGQHRRFYQYRSVGDPSHTAAGNSPITGQLASGSRSEVCVRTATWRGRHAISSIGVGRVTTWRVGGVRRTGRLTGQRRPPTDASTGIINTDARVVGRGLQHAAEYGLDQHFREFICT